jgi:hypothetical protein
MAWRLTIHFVTKLPMNMPFGNDAEILRSAIAWALHVADASNNPLVASFLADALHHAEDGAYGSCAATGANSPGWNAGAWSAER